MILGSKCSIRTAYLVYKEVSLEEVFCSRIVFLLIMPVLVSTWDFLEAHAEGWRVLAAGGDKKYKYLINEIKIFPRQVVLL